MRTRPHDVWVLPDKCLGNLMDMWLFCEFKNFVGKRCQLLVTAYLIHRDTVWSVLTGRAYEGTPSIVLHDVREIETWILRLLSVPVPVPGKTRVEVCLWFDFRHRRRCALP